MEKLSTTSPQPPNVSSTGPLILATDRASPETAARRAALLLGCYRKGDAHDPDTYVAAIASILAEYANETVAYVTDPRTGIARRSTWMPSVQEVDLACLQHAAFCANRDELLRRGFVKTATGGWVAPARIDQA